MPQLLGKGSDTEPVSMQDSVYARQLRLHRPTLQHTTVVCGLEKPEIRPKTLGSYRFEGWLRPKGAGSKVSNPPVFVKNLRSAAKSLVLSGLASFMSPGSQQWKFLRPKTF